MYFDSLSTFSALLSKVSRSSLSVLTDMPFLLFQKQKELAFKYWSGEKSPQASPASQEVLFVGTVTVIEVAPLGFALVP